MAAVGINFCGGFGNQLFQYAFARAYAEAHRAVLLTPGWIGQRIFDISNQPLNYDLPHAGFDEIPNGRINVVLNGYFQSQAAVDMMSRAKLKSWFTLRDKWKQRFQSRPRIAAHVRRGDYVGLSNIYCLVSENSYIAICNKLGLNVADICWVQEGRKEPHQDLIDAGVPFLEDFITLMNAEILLRANSSFSWWAGTLGDGRIFSPLVENRTGEHDVTFVEGNWPRMVDSSNCHANVTDLHLKD
jgi:hypothetical protein